MVIYNEIINVMKIIMFIFHQKQKKRIPGLRLACVNGLNFEAKTELEYILKE